MSLEWVGGDGPPLVFAHANGFPPRAYSSFLKHIAQVYSVTAPAHLLAMNPSSINRWQSGSAKLIELVESRFDTKVVAMGHSLGATQWVYAVAERPELFSALVLIEPAMVAANQAAMLHAAPWWLRRRIPLVRSTLNKRDRWNSMDDFRASCRRSGLYADIPEDVFNHMTSEMVVADNGELRLIYPKALEARFFMTAPDPTRNLAQVRLPVIGLRGESSVYLDDRRWDRLKAARPDGFYEQMDGVGHLMPFEAPAATAGDVLKMLAEIE